MKNSYCSAQQIFELNGSKEYTLTATPILEKALTDNRLVSQAAKLWQFLFGKSKYDKNLCVKISYSILANEFNKSTRTISRWVKSLENVGYLVVQHNYNALGGQLKNTLLVRIPEDVYLHAQTAKDRKSKIEESPQLKFVAARPHKKALPVKLPYVSEEELSTPETPEKHTKSEVSAEIPDNFVMGEGDNFVLHKDISFKEIIKNNNIQYNQNSTETENPVVVFDENTNIQLKKEEDICTINQELDSLENHLGALVKLMVEIGQDNSIPEKHEKLLSLYEERRKIDSRIATLELKKEQLLRTTEKTQENIALSKNISHIHNAKGERAISPFTFKRLVAKLSAMGYSGKNLTQLVNEILFEVRFGSLRQSTKGDDLNTEKAVNIGIKLVREKRWTTPSALM